MGGVSSSGFDLAEAGIARFGGTGLARVQRRLRLGAHAAARLGHGGRHGLRAPRTGRRTRPTSSRCAPATASTASSTRRASPRRAGEWTDVRLPVASFVADLPRARAARRAAARPGPRARARPHDQRPAGGSVRAARGPHRDRALNAARAPRRCPQACCGAPCPACSAIPSLAAAEAAVAARDPRDPARDVVAARASGRGASRRAPSSRRRRRPSRRCAPRSRGSSPTSRGRRSSGTRSVMCCAGSSRTNCALSTRASSTPSGSGARRSASSATSSGRPARHDGAPSEAKARFDALERASAWWDWLIAQEKIAEREQARAAFLALDGVARTWEGTRDRLAPRFRQSPGRAPRGREGAALARDCRPARDGARGTPVAARRTVCEAAGSRGAAKRGRARSARGSPRSRGRS